jgi:LacI family transcriptional regulator
VASPAYQLDGNPSNGAYAADEADLLLILCSSAGSREREDWQLRLLEEQRVAGILMSPIERSPSRRVRDLHSRGTPVLLDRYRSARQWCSAAVNDTSGARLAAEHLIGVGHKRIALVDGPTSLTPCAERRSSFLEVLAEHGLSLNAAHDLEQDGMTIEAGEEAANQLLNARSLPTAVFCTNDLLALGMERGALTRAVRVPDDLAIVGYDDIRFAATALVPLTTVRHPAHELGYRSAKLLIDEATNGAEHRHQRLLFEPELVVRESTSGASGATNGPVQMGGVRSGPERRDVSALLRRAFVARPRTTRARPSA